MIDRGLAAPAGDAQATGTAPAAKYPITGPKMSLY